MYKQIIKIIKYIFANFHITFLITAFTQQLNNFKYNCVMTTSHKKIRIIIFSLVAFLAIKYSSAVAYCEAVPSTTDLVLFSQEESDQIPHQQIQAIDSDDLLP